VVNVGTLTQQQASSGSSGAIGPPAIYSVLSNSLTASAALLSVTNDSSSQTSRLMLVFLDWHPVTGTPTANVYCRGTNMTCLSISSWFTDSSNAIYYLPAPATGSGLVEARWSGNVDEAAIHAVVLTNSAQVSIFGTVAKTNHSENIFTITNWIASATNELVVNYVVLANDTTGVSPTYNAAWTPASFRETGAAEHCSAVSTMLGIAATVTNIITFTASGPQNAMGVSVRGLQ
jgi:hypothetical protein